MNEVTSLLGIGIALGLGAASPGPSFVMIARTAASAGRDRGLSAALGMGLGAVLFATASLLGLNAVFRAVPTLYMALKLGGGGYLAYLGWRIWRGAGRALEVRAEEENAPSPPARGRRASLLLGLATQLSNPKTAIVYASVFAAFLPAAPGLRYQLAVVALVFLVETGWYALVAAALSAVAPRALYLRHKKWLDRAAGGLMGALGLKLAASAAGPH